MTWEYPKSFEAENAWRRLREYYKAGNRDRVRLTCMYEYYLSVAMPQDLKKHAALLRKMGFG